MLIDMHAHTSGISHCCKAGARDIMLAAKAAGIDGLIISNHYQESYVTATPADFARAYADEYYYAKSFEAETGVRLFFGIEVTAKLHENAHILVYG
ncbi:MAG: PHP domain-containing protein, partial [Mogibacterium sp.]|nr:PHP domain-containing protein [Mogibacterium sp.]